MPPRRIEPLEQPIALRVDGRDVPAREGEPVAVALTAAGRLVLGRSVKYHRPRGAACYAGRCDGCLMRVDGLPNVMTCRMPARDGMTVETQNVVGSAHADLLAVTDWFYPRGMDHHQMFTWSKPVNQMMQRVARRIAGIGRLPEQPVSPVALETDRPDVLVVGGGPAGLLAAAECASAGHRVRLVEDTGVLGGHLCSFPGTATTDDGEQLEPRTLATRLADRARAAGAQLDTDSGAMGAYEEPGHGSPVPTHPPDGQPVRGDNLVVTVTTPQRTVCVRPRRLIVATGTHEGTLPIAGNDLPGVVGGRGLLALLRHGVLLGERVAVVGQGAWAEGIAREVQRAGGEALGPFEPESVQRIRGRPRAKAIDVIAEGGETRRVRCDAVAMVPLPSAAYELAAQAGAGVQWEQGRFRVDASPDDGATRAPWLRAVGECTGRTELPEILAQARAAARAVVRELAEPAAKPDTEEAR